MLPAFQMDACCSQQGGERGPLGAELGELPCGSHGSGRGLMSIEGISLAKSAGPWCLTSGKKPPWLSSAREWGRRIAMALSLHGLQLLRALEQPQGFSGVNELCGSWA